MIFCVPTPVFKIEICFTWLSVEASPVARVVVVAVVIFACPLAKELSEVIWFTQEIKAVTAEVELVTISIACDVQENRIILYT